MKTLKTYIAECLAEEIAETKSNYTISEIEVNDVINKVIHTKNYPTLKNHIEEEYEDDMIIQVNGKDTSDNVYTNIENDSPYQWVVLKNNNKEIALQLLKFDSKNTITLVIAERSKNAKNETNTFKYILDCVIEKYHPSKIITFALHDKLKDKYISFGFKAGKKDELVKHIDEAFDDIICKDSAGNWRIKGHPGKGTNTDKLGLWKAKYKTRKDAEAALRSYFSHKNESKIQSLKNYIKQHDNSVISEGGMGGHMSHPIDYDDISFAELKDMLDKLFNGEIENVKEKLDGTNINATVNKNGNVVFIRNKGDINSQEGGMSIDDMAAKWKDKPSVAKNYINGGKIITKIFSNIDNKFFNPDDETKVIVNCEVISAGQTNVMLYEKDRVAFHGTATYKLKNGKWELESESEGEPKEIRDAAKDIDEAAPRPQLIIKNAEKAKEESTIAKNELDSMMKKYHMSYNDTILDWKRKRYNDIAPKWANNDECFNRIILQDKLINLRELKKTYPELPAYEKSKDAKKLYQDIMEPLDTLFSNIGNALISLLDGFTNSGNEDKVTSLLKNELENVKTYVDNEGTDEMKDVMVRSLQRLSKLNNKINSTEGIVFQYNGRLMKMTGSFAAFNQALGVRFMKA